MKFKNHIARLLALAIFVTSGMLPSYAASFNDLKGYEWAEKYIDDVSKKEILRGYPDKTFRPGSPVSRIEAIIMMTNLHPKSEIDSVYNANVSKYKKMLTQYNIEEWARPYIVFAIEKRIIPNTDKMISSFVDQKTKKAVIAMRYELVVFLVRSLNIEKEANPKATLTYKDSKNIIAQAVPFIELLQRKGVLSKLGDGNGYFLPKKSITRAEAAVMLSNAYKYSSRARGSSSSLVPTVPSIPTPTPTPSPTPTPVPAIPAQPVEETLGGTINLVTLADPNFTISFTTPDGKTKNFTSKQREVSVKQGDKIMGISDLKVGQQGHFTIKNNVLTQISIPEVKTERYSGILKNFSIQDKTLSIEIEKDARKEEKVLRYDDNTKIYVNDTLTAVQDLKKDVNIDLNVENNIIAKASITITKEEINGDITDFSYNSLTLNTANGKVTKEFADDVKMYRNDKRVDTVSSLAIGDKAKITTDKDKIVEINVDAKKQKYLSAVIKGIEMNNTYNKLIIQDKDSKEYSLTVNNDTIIRVKDKRSNIYSLQLGYEVDIYTEGGLIEEIESRGEFKQTTVTGSVVDIDLVDKFIELRQGDGKKIKLYYDSNTRVERYSNGAIIDPRNIINGDTITGIGVLNGGNINASRIMVQI